MKSCMANSKAGERIGRAGNQNKTGREIWNEEDKGARELGEE